MKSSKADIRAKMIDEAIKLTWSSLQSHLGYTYTETPKGYTRERTGRAFHKKCVQDYTRVITILTKLY